MNQEKIKKQLLSEHFIEDMQRSLEEMPEDVAKQIIDSMTDREIYVRVNKRRMQEDYIADYIDFLWDISRDAFWKHVSATFNVTEGLLWAGDMLYIEKVCSNKMPDFLLQKLIDFWVAYQTQNSADSDLNIEGLGCILKAQCVRFGQKENILKYLIEKYPTLGHTYGEKLDYFINSDCHYNFY